MMIAVGIAALIPAFERLLYRCSADLVTSRNEFLESEAVLVWIIRNVGLSLPAGAAIAVRAWSR